ncbi:MAG: protoporphyrinogen oxidase [Nitrospinota bacterium]|nr:MAG: protoporphyrinogen oxidase [Nitrospinota bacterium]
MRHVVVIGGGISGLTACYRLVTEAQQRGIPLQVTLLEASERVGGVIKTSRQDGFLIEHGPDAFLSTKPRARALCEELGLADQLIGTNPQQRQSFVLCQGKLQPVPEGFYMMAPASFWPFVTTPIFSWRGKLRMALDLVIPPRRDGADESLEQFVKRRLGEEAFTRMAQPMVAGVYTADPRHLSLKATMPQFLEMEQQYGSLIRALLHRKKAAQRTPTGTSGPRYSLFLTLQTGMQTLTDTLAARLPAGTIRCKAEVQQVERLAPSRQWRIVLRRGEEMRADALCIALPALQAATLVKTIDPELADLLAAIPYASSATLNFAFRRQEVTHPLNGMGFVVPLVEGRSLLACSFSSVKFAGRAPADHVLLRAFVGGALQPHLFEQPESALVEQVLRDLRELLGIRAEPIHAVVSRHLKAMPQYHVGHLERVEHITARLRSLPGLALVGNAYRGIGVPDCIQSAEQGASQLLDYLTARSA